MAALVVSLAGCFTFMGSDVLPAGLSATLRLKEKRLDEISPSVKHESNNSVDFIHMQSYSLNPDVRYGS